MAGKKLLINFLFSLSVLLLFVFFIIYNNGPWTSADYRINDIIYRSTLAKTSPLQSNRILYLTITDQTYREIFNNNYFRRDIFADILNKVTSLNPESVLIDLIFAYPSDNYSDSLLLNAVKTSKNVYLPAPLTNSGPANDNTFLSAISYTNITEIGRNEFQKAETYIPDIFSNSGITNYGHVNVFPDADGVFRHSTILISVDTFLIPSISFRLFLDYYKVKQGNISVKWGDQITIQADEENLLYEDLKIPIDGKGRMFIPVSDKWGDDFLHLSVNRFLELYNDPLKRTRLEDLFESRIIVIGDISTGISDLANTSLDENVPLLVLAAHELNTYLSSTFYTELNSTKTVWVSLIILIVLFTLSVMKNSRHYTYAGAVVMTSLLFAAVISSISNILIPAASIMVYTFSLWIVLFISIGLNRHRENKKIKEEVIKKNYDLEQARKLQMSLLPHQLPSNSQYEITAYLRSADEVGGDYYDIKYNDEEAIIILGDVIGHGLKAGMMSLIIKTLFSALPAKADLMEILSNVDSSIRKLRIEMFFLGLLLVKIKGQEISVVSAGMPPLIYFDSTSGCMKEMIIKSPPLGAFKFDYQSEEISLSKGDIILIYSDGLSELFNAQKEMLGIERIKDYLFANKEKHAASIKDAIVDLISSWTGGNSPHDDITFVLIKMK